MSLEVDDINNDNVFASYKTKTNDDITDEGMQKNPYVHCRGGYVFRWAYVSVIVSDPLFTYIYVVKRSPLNSRQSQ
jgi:hypothetical protein